MEVHSFFGNFVVDRGGVIVEDFVVVRLTICCFLLPLLARAVDFATKNTGYLLSSVSLSYTA